VSNINVEPALTRGERLRRVVRLCADFTRNLAYYRASLQYSTAWSLRTNDGAFWRTVHNNALDTCVLEWCKLFGGRNDQHSWSRTCRPARRPWWRSRPVVIDHEENSPEQTVTLIT
jgi:hypothetical protein